MSKKHKQVHGDWEDAQSRIEKAKRAEAIAQERAERRERAAAKAKDREDREARRMDAERRRAAAAEANRKLLSAHLKEEGDG